MRKEMFNENFIKLPKVLEEKFEGARSCSFRLGKSRKSTYSNFSKGILQIVLLVCSVFAFAYILEDVNGSGEIIVIEKKGINWKLLYRVLVGMIFSEKTLVSALEVSDLESGVETCFKGKDGAICQEYPASECDANCEEECFPAPRENTAGCQLGTCYDSSIGTCQEGSPELRCEEFGGEWFDDPFGNILQCQKACCVVGNEVVPLVTARECEYISETQGVETEYRGEIRGELECLNLGRTQIEGACMFDSGEGACKFSTKQECLDNGGDFFEGFLCSHPSLNSGCEKEDGAKCVEGQDELYWFDSCGNRENIYDARGSWNGGMILAKSESCDLGTNLNPMRNQDSCGNCNRFLGSVCGDKTSRESLEDGGIDFVCRDMRCKDRFGESRENGESWCEYQGALGVDEGTGGFIRGVETPGSRHFRGVCVDGEVQVNPCADYRNQICIEDIAERITDGEDISSAACVTNLWQLCVNYNSEIEGEGEDRTRSLEERDKKCGENPHCELKKVDIADSFKFDLCVPRHSPGFNLQKNAEGGELSCAFANQKCTVIYVKKISGWSCEANCDCERRGFAEQMNDLCISLGDCGASVNYQGDLTENYRVYESPELGLSYLNGIKRYSNPVEGEHVEPGNIFDYFDAIGGIEKLRGNYDPDICEGLSGACPGDLTIASTVSGLLGTAVLASPKLGAVPLLTTSTTTASGTTVALSAVGGALAGAAIGFAVTSLLIQLTGIGPGLDPAMVWGLIATGTLGGALVGAALASSTVSSLGPAILSIGIVPFLGVILILVVVILIVVFYALGIGDIEEINVEFQCQAWQPPLGGKGCDKCGDDGYPCSPYSCQSLGQTCRLINEGSGEEKCVDISPNDITAPRINAWEEVLSEGFEYENDNDRGVRIVSNENDGCLRANEFVTFGIGLNEPGKCSYDVEHKNNIEDMRFDFGFRNLYLENHTHLFSVPDMSSLGIPGYDPEERAEYNLFVRCIDGNGNGKDSAEYVINMCVRPGEDVAETVVTGREPLLEDVVFNSSELFGSVFTNEPASCRWGAGDNDYDGLENEMDCENSIVDRVSLFGWKCSSTFPIDQDEEKYYIRCKDQPHLAGTNESERNEMGRSYEFDIKRTRNELTIDSLKPNNETLIFGVKPATVELEVTTSGGFDDGRAECSIFAGTAYTAMDQTFETVHNQPINVYFSGDNSYLIRCEDQIGNFDEKELSFSAEVDTSPPRVSRVYRFGGELVVVTDEEGSECSYSLGGSCGFEFEQGTGMSRDSAGVRHSIDFSDATYYVKCRDKFGNEPGSCSVVVEGGEEI